MKGCAKLSWLRLCHHRGQTLAMVLALAAAMFVPATTNLLVLSYRESLTARAASTPLVMGAKGNRFDLTLSALYLRHTELEPLHWSEIDKLEKGGEATPIPLHLSYTARGFVVVGTTPEYFDWKHLKLAAGSRPLRLGDVVLGARVASELGLAAGGTLFSDPVELYDISKPPALEMNVVGVLDANGEAEDGAVFVDVKTAWVLEGILHGHEEAKAVNPGKQVLGETGENRILSPALVEYQRVTDQNLGSFHLHGDPGELPIHAIVVLPKSVKDATLAKARVNTGATTQMVVPSEVVGEMLEMVFAIKRFVDRFALVLSVATLLLVSLVFLLSTRLREREMLTLERIGCDRSTTTMLYVSEGMIVLLAAAAVAGVGSWVATKLIGDVTRWL